MRILTMLKNKINFDNICNIISDWTWNELKVGLEKSIISNSQIISYAVLVLSEDIDQFDSVLELSISKEDEVEEILFNLATKEGKYDLKMINSKWIFAIIYDAYSYLNDEIYDVIEDVYTEFGYPKEISNLIGYMPCDDSRSMNEKLNEYINISRNVWC